MTEFSSNLPQIVLVSASPRRQAILRKLGIPFLTAPANVDEESIPFATPRELALKAAYTKVMARAHEWPNSILIGCDTVVALDGRVYGKPRDAEDACRMLRELSGRRHSVISGLAIKATPSSVHLDAEESFVTFRELSDDEILSYIESGEPMDKAGAYAIQGLASKFITKVDGDYWNVVGLPIDKLLSVLEQFIDVRAFRSRLAELKRDEIQ